MSNNTLVKLVYLVLHPVSSTFPFVFFRVFVLHHGCVKMLGYVMGTCSMLKRCLAVTEGSNFADPGHTIDTPAAFLFRNMFGFL